MILQAALTALWLLLAIGLLVGIGYAWVAISAWSARNRKRRAEAAETWKRAQTKETTPPLIAVSSAGTPIAVDVKRAVAAQSDDITVARVKARIRKAKKK